MNGVFGVAKCGHLMVWPMTTWENGTVAMLMNARCFGCCEPDGATLMRSNALRAKWLAT